MHSYKQEEMHKPLFGIIYLVIIAAYPSLAQIMNARPKAKYVLESFLKPCGSPKMS